MNYRSTLDIDETPFDDPILRLEEKHCFTFFALTISFLCAYNGHTIFGKCWEVESEIREYGKCGKI